MARPRGRLVKGRRIPLDKKAHGLLGKLTEPGDYAGPTTAYTDGRPAVFFLLPIARDTDAPPQARALHHVTSPPHVFRECSDGSLEIRESIGAGSPRYWHGYLDEGHEWREA
jgi:hypothetical protein